MLACDLEHERTGVGVGLELGTATLRLAPASPIFLTMQARCLLEAGDAAGARAHLARAFDARADFPTAHVVAGLLEEREGNASAALAHYDALLAREPGHVVSKCG